jgi:pyrimidine-nucleoside phosphorylase
VTALVTNMDAPLGLTIGNALETREAIDVLFDRGPADVRELTLRLGTEMLLVAGVERTVARARARLLHALTSDEPRERFRKMIRAHGGDPRVVDDPERLPRARVKALILSPKSGYVVSIDPLALGLLSVELGAGRRRAEDPVEPGVGLELAVQVGARIERGKPLGWIHARDRASATSAQEQFIEAFRFSTHPPRKSRLVHARIVG